MARTQNAENSGAYSLLLPDITRHPYSSLLALICACCHVEVGESLMHFSSCRQYQADLQFPEDLKPADQLEQVKVVANIVECYVRMAEEPDPRDNTDFKCVLFDMFPGELCS